MMPTYYVLFWKQDRLAFGLWKWCLFLVLILCIHELVWKFSWLLTTKFINESVYWYEIGKICHFLNKLLHKVLGCAPATNLTTFFCRANIFLLLEEIHKGYAFYTVMFVQFMTLIINLSQQGEMPTVSCFIMFTIFSATDKITDQFTEAKGW
jgi:hypothetical protein